MSQSPEERILLAELAASGYPLSSIWDWVNRPVYAPGAVPILVRHLESCPNEGVVEAIARALTDRRYLDAELPLVRTFPRIVSDSVRWAIADAITTVGFRRAEDAVLAYCGDPRFGKSRELLVGALHRVKRPTVEPLLISLLADQGLDYFAADALLRCGGRAALAALEGMDLGDRSPRTRRKVPKVVERLRSRVAAA